MTQVSNFWVPVSQIIPVLALAFVIESRRIAMKWRRENKSRLGQAIGIFFLAAGMFNAELWALSSMATGTSTHLQVWIALFTVGAVVFVLAFQPISFLVGAGIPEVGVMLNRLERGSDWQVHRKRLRELRRTQRKARRDLMKQNDRLVRIIRKEEADRRSFDRVVEGTRGLIARVAAEPGLLPEERGRRTDALAALLETRKQMVDRSDKRLLEARQIQSDGEAYLSKLAKDIVEVDQLARDTRVYRMFDEDAEQIERVMARLKPEQPEAMPPQSVAAELTSSEDGH